ncbi:uncharacterized protein G2W53_020167 [Senna tora]|uniref:Uncharacterized protein n=1 Tax=Senna tora TaxID=362788 RepID=A0A834TUX3_9FABA|nr:uncharacterized protein G2W53_020167 [Senna tora]
MPHSIRASLPPISILAVSIFPETLVTISVISRFTSVTISIISCLVSEIVNSTWSLVSSILVSMVSMGLKTLDKPATVPRAPAVPNEQWNEGLQIVLGVGAKSVHGSAQAATSSWNRGRLAQGAIGVAVASTVVILGYFLSKISK